MLYNKNLYGFDIDIASLEVGGDFSKESYELIGVASDSFFDDRFNITLLFEDNQIVTEIFNINAYNDIKAQLKEWSYLKAYYTFTLDPYDAKEDHIIKAIKKEVLSRDQSDIDDIFNDIMEYMELETLEEARQEGDYYYDSSLSSIVDYLYNLYDDCDTMYQIDHMTKTVLGFYGDAFIMEVEEEGFYLFFK